MSVFKAYPMVKSLMQINLAGRYLYILLSFSLETHSWPPYFSMAPPSPINESGREGGPEELYSTEGS